MAMKKVDQESFDEEQRESFTIYRARVQKSDKILQRKSEIPSHHQKSIIIGSPKLQFKLFSPSQHHLSPLSKISSLQQTSLWVLKSDFSSGFDGDYEMFSESSTSSINNDGSHQKEFSDDDGLESTEQSQNETELSVRCVERSHSLFLGNKQCFNSSELFKDNDEVCQYKTIESNDFSSPYDCLPAATETSYLFLNQDETFDSTYGSKSPEKNLNSSYSVSSSKCDPEPHVATVEFVCHWNACSHMETSTDRLFHHILHRHLHRSTDFRSSGCLWRGCSKDGIPKVFNSRHKLLVHVGIHCQNLKEPHKDDESSTQVQCAPQTDQLRNASLSNTMPRVREIDN